MSDVDRQRRARERRERIVVGRASLDGSTDVVPIAGPEAVSLAYRLSRLAWQLAGRPFPSYERADIPIRFRALDES